MTVRSLAEVLVDEWLAHLAAGEALPAAARVIAAGRAEHWDRRIRDVARRLHAPSACPSPSWSPTSTSGTPTVTAPPTRRPRTSQVRDRITGQDQLPPTQRWAHLVRQVDPRFVQADSWAPLAAALAQAHRSGHDLPSYIDEALAQGPLDPQDPGSDLKWRLLADLPAEPTDWGQVRRAMAAIDSAPRTPSASPSPARPRPGHTRPGRGQSPKR